MIDIHCPNCTGTNWYCWDERYIDGVNPDGTLFICGCIGYLKCRDCGHAWTDSDVPNDIEINEDIP